MNEITEKHFEEKEGIQVEQSESVKLIKNSRGYNWEIRLLEVDIERLSKLNDEMVKRFQYEE